MAPPIKVDKKPVTDEFQTTTSIKAHIWEEDKQFKTNWSSWGTAIIPTKKNTWVSYL